jgi:hypothetical protein
MAVRGCGMAVTDGPQLVNSDVVFFASGGTLDASNVVQINFDDSVFVTTQPGLAEGKQRLLAHLQMMIERIQATAVWPVTTAS